MVSLKRISSTSSFSSSFSSSVLLLHLLLLISFDLSSVNRVAAERDAVLFCGACIALVEELNWMTGITSPKKKIQVGSFHLDAKGNSGAREIPLATSETYLTELYENVCRYMWFYSKSVGRNGQTHYIRTSSRDGHEISMKNVEVSDKVRDELRYACDWVLEEYDDWMVPLYQAKDREIATKLCVEKSGLCTESNVTDHLWAYASAVMDGQRERAAEAGFSDFDDPNKFFHDDDDDDYDDDDDDDDDEEIVADGEEETDLRQKNSKSEL